jgi:hypothetical protein
MSAPAGPPSDIPPGWVAWVEDGKVIMEEDAGGSPGSWPVEEDS